MRNSKLGRTLADGGLLPMDENLTPIISNYIRFNKLWLNYRALECVKVQFGARQGHCTALELQQAAICSTKAITGSTEAATSSNEDPTGSVAGPGSDGSTLDPTGATQQNWSGVGSNIAPHLFS